MLFKQVTTCFLGTLLFFSSFNVVASKILANYDELLHALNNGSKVRGVIHLDKCKLNHGGGLPKTFSFGFTYDYYNHYNLPIDKHHSVEVISTSQNIFSITRVNDLGPVNNYLQIHVLRDNTAHLFGAMLDPKKYDQKITARYTCPISSDPTQAGLMLFDPDA